MKYILRYRTNQEFIDAQGVNPGEDVQVPIPGVAYTDEAAITDYNPIPRDVPTLIVVNETNQPGTVTFTAKEVGTSSSYFSTLGNRPSITIEYSTDNQFFSAVSSADIPETGDVVRIPVSVPANGRLYLRGDNTTFAVGKMDPTDRYSIAIAIKYWSFNCDVRHSLEGNLFALLSDATGVTEDFELAGLFEGDDMLREVADTVLSSEYIPKGACAFLFRQSQDTVYGLEKMPKIDATEIGAWGCYKMFQNATFETLESLPATKLGQGAYYAMFLNSKHLTGGTAQIADAGANGDYNAWDSMFQGCTALTKAPEILQTEAHHRGMMHMFAGCTSLVEPPVMHISSYWGKSDSNYAQECFGYMFQYCTSLTATPIFFRNVSAANGNLNNYNSLLFQYMFRGCTSLVHAEDLNFKLGGGCFYAGMFSGCTSLVIPPKIELVSCFPNNNYYGHCMDMFAGCTALTEMPDIKITSLALTCCAEMFKECTSLTVVKTLPATSFTNTQGNPAIGCYQNMFEGCTGITAVTNLPAAAPSQSAYNNMFKNCTNLTHIKCMATDLSATDCTTDWVNGVAASGTFVKAASADWSVKTGNDGIPAGWTVQDA